jgi:hypothetical protein
MAGCWLVPSPPRLPQQTVLDHDPESELHVSLPEHECAPFPRCRRRVHQGSRRAVRFQQVSPAASNLHSSKSLALPVSHLIQSDIIKHCSPICCFAVTEAVNLFPYLQGLRFCTTARHNRSLASTSPVADISHLLFLVIFQVVLPAYPLASMLAI